MKFVATKEALSDKLSLCSAIAEKRQTIRIVCLFSAMAEHKESLSDRASLVATNFMLLMS